MATTFLSAEWRNLLMANYIVDPAILMPYLPAHTELDTWNGNCYVSLVGFMFVDTRVRGVKVPGHINFQEVNLRFYVLHTLADGTKRRGVVFIKEIVPKRAITFIANTLYRENYETMPMKHVWEARENELFVAYQWLKRDWHGIEVVTDLVAKEIEQGSEAEFITEHYWGYARVNDRVSTQYEVAHPRWKVHDVTDYKIAVDFGLVYGADFSFLNNAVPASVFLADGSPIEVMGGGKLR